MERGADWAVDSTGLEAAILGAKRCRGGHDTVTAESALEVMVSVVLFVAMRQPGLSLVFLKSCPAEMQAER